jgi:uncharacterized protein YndB with AHSA1/START domain
MTPDPITLEVDVRASPRQLWRAWTDGEELTRWPAARAHVSPEIGGRYELIWEPEHPERNSTVGCRITAFVPLEVLAFTWKGPVPFADLMNVEPSPTTVVLTFASLGPGLTRVRLQHFGWGDGPCWAAARAWHEQAWNAAFARLRAQFGSSRLTRAGARCRSRERARSGSPL